VFLNSTGLEARHAWLNDLVNQPPAATVELHKSTAVSSQSLQRKRPFIYVYDLPAKYNSRMLQYRVDK
jgi:hypothetical protein